MSAVAVVNTILPALSFAVSVTSAALILLGFLRATIPMRSGGAAQGAA